MALLAEQIVEEWLRRQGYFTIRGLKLGLEEIDILAIKNSGNEKWDMLHVEVQVSIRPVSYISGLTKNRQTEFSILGSRNAKYRTDEQLEIAVNDWIEKKYFNHNKKQIRKQLSNSEDWKYLFVYGKVKSEKELELIKKSNVDIKNIKDILFDLQRNDFKYTTSSATDIIELIGFTKEN